MKRLIIAMVLLAAFIASRAEAKIELVPHGIRTQHVIATRYRNPLCGYNIGFVFPHDENVSDSAKLCGWIEKHGGTILSCGGYPGAEMLVSFEGVTDKASANAKLQSLLPDLDKFIVTLKE